ncbi:hypothetical protein EYF80_001126 [Liparis tanakae]|uniref:Uncharacterized protein n=1 Tax=Liparis tanakae TaxID=230148 RepID=A0A4Z2JG72_9TELE|nr:hypothetical protein EYF80_001126 [Liparis tanakae]
MHLQGPGALAEVERSFEAAAWTGPHSSVTSGQKRLKELPNKMTPHPELQREKGVSQSGGEREKNKQL